MGEMADYINEFIEDILWYADGYEPDREDEGIRSPYRITCKYCGEKELKWEHVGYGWRLFCRDDAIHDCKTYHHSRNNKISLL